MTEPDYVAKTATFMNALSRFLHGRNARVIGLGLSLVLLLLIVRALYLERHQLAEVKVDRDFIVAGVLSVLVVTSGNFLGSVASWLLLRNHAQEITLPYSITINGLAQMAKYVPGNVLHLVGRFYLIGRLTGAKTALIFSIVEVLLLCLAGCSLGLLYLHYLQPVDWPLPLLGLLSLLLLASGIYVLFRTKLLNVSATDICAVVFFYLFSFLCYGLAFNLLFSLVFDLQSVGGLLCAALFSLAFVVGYVTPGASGGLGVREFVFMVLSQPLMDSTLAVAAVILFRFFSIAGDLVFALLSFGVRKFYQVRLLE